MGNELSYLKVEMAVKDVIARGGGSIQELSQPGVYDKKTLEFMVRCTWEILESLKRKAQETQATGVIRDE